MTIMLGKIFGKLYGSILEEKRELIGIIGKGQSKRTSTF